MKLVSLHQRVNHRYHRRNEVVADILQDHELEIAQPDIELLLPDEAFVVLRLAAGVVPPKDVRLVGLVVIRVNAAQRTDLVPRQTRRRVLPGAARQRLGAEAGPQGEFENCVSRAVWAMSLSLLRRTCIFWDR